MTGVVLPYVTDSPLTARVDSGDVTRASAPHTWRGSNKSLWYRCMRIPIVIKAHKAWVVAAFNWPLKKKCFLSILFQSDENNFDTRLYIRIIFPALLSCNLWYWFLRADLLQQGFFTGNVVFLVSEPESATWSYTVASLAALKEFESPATLLKKFLARWSVHWPSKLISIPAMVNIIC